MPVCFAVVRCAMTVQLICAGTAFADRADTPNFNRRIARSVRAFNRYARNRLPIIPCRGSDVSLFESSFDSVFTFPDCRSSPTEAYSIDDVSTLDINIADIPMPSDDLFWS